jgi:hypothetical protein
MLKSKDILPVFGQVKNIKYTKSFYVAQLTHKITEIQNSVCVTEGPLLLVKCGNFPPFRIIQNFN